MGLDMYLYLRKYESLGSWDKNFNSKKRCFYPVELREFSKKIAKSNYLSKETCYQVGYWRKANAIHKFFVDMCADGTDDCSKIYVSLENLEDLKKRVDTVLKDHSKAEELLPSTSGFFFGSTDYDEWYYQDLKYTQKLLTEVIEFVKTDEHYDVIYQASW